MTNDFQKAMSHLMYLQTVFLGFLVPIICFVNQTLSLDLVFNLLMQQLNFLK